jgi:hypothetical protein
MPIDPKKLAALTEQMRSLGLPDPENAAREELKTGDPILATQSFLKWLTDEMVRPGDYRWIDGTVADQEDSPVLGPALARLLKTGADRDDVIAVGRVLQYRICHHICTMLDQVSLPGYVPIQDFGVYHVGGGDSPTTDKPIVRLEGLHEQIEAWDPESED